MTNNPYDSIITNMRSGNSNDPYVYIKATHKIINNKVELSEIPDKFNHVKVKYNNTYLNEVEDEELTENLFSVNYPSGLVEFHSSKNGEMVDIEYFGKGANLFPSSRVYLNQEKNDIVSRNIQDFADEMTGRVNNLISSNPQPQEIEDVRTDVGGYVNPTAKIRVDKMEQEVRDARQDPGGVEHSDIKARMDNEYHKIDVLSDGIKNIKSYPTYNGDWYESIKTAVAETPINGKLKFPKGNYNVLTTNKSGLVIDRSDIVVEFEENAKIIMDNNDTNGNATGNGIHIKDGAQNVTLINPQVEWKNQPATRTYLDGIKIEGLRNGARCKNIRINGGSVKYTGATFLWAKWVDGLSIQNFDGFESMADGVFIRFCKNIYVDGVNIMNTADDGISLAYEEPDMASAVLDDWHCSNARLFNITVDGRSTAHPVADTAGIQLSGCKDVIVDGLKVKNKDKAFRQEIGSNPVISQYNNVNYLANKDVTIRNFKFENVKEGIYLRSYSNKTQDSKLWNQKMLFDGGEINATGRPITTASGSDDQGNSLKGVHDGVKMNNVKAFTTSTTDKMKMYRLSNFELTNLETNVDLELLRDDVTNIDNESYMNIVLDNIKAKKILINYYKGVRSRFLYSQDSDGMGAQFLYSKDFIIDKLTVKNSSRATASSAMQVGLNSKDIRIGQLDILHDDKTWLGSLEVLTDKRIDIDSLVIQTNFNTTSDAVIGETKTKSRIRSIRHIHYGDPYPFWREYEKHIGDFNVDDQYGNNAIRVLPDGHVRIGGSDGGKWNTRTLRLGAFYFWVDSTSRLRIKSGAPTSDTDGTIVGTQA